MSKVQYFKHASFVLLSALLVISCMKYAQKKDPNTIRQNAANAIKKTKEIKAQSTLKVDEGLQLSLWATDSLAPDPVAMSIDDQGRVYLTRTNRQKNSEFDIRGHRDWMTPSTALKTVEDRRAFLHQTFAPERSKENEWLKDLNYDGIHDWHDLAVEKEEVWRLEDTNKDGIADVSKRIVNDFNDEITDIAAGILVRENDAFLAVAPDIWHLENKNKNGVYTKKTSISTGYGVHIGFSGHNLSGIVEGPDGRIYWNIGDIGATVTDKNGKKWENPNSGFIARSNPDGSDFEIFATGLRNTHEFAFDEYGNLISCDNDSDQPGESERLVHIVEGSDAGWRSNWQYGKYTDPKNNGYKVWMDEKLHVPHWEGQAAYIVPPIQNFHNGPTGMVYNPGTALGSAWKNKFFVVEFVGNPSNSPIWAFGLKPKGASFELDGEKNILSGVLPTGIYFGPDGALYVADWVTGWGTKDYGRVWKLDVTAEKNDLAAARKETQRLMLLDYSKQTPDQLYAHLSNADLRIRKKAQFELVKRGSVGLTMLNNAVQQNANQLARIHGIWGIGQMIRNKTADVTTLTPFLKDHDSEIIAQAAKALGDISDASVATNILPLLQNANPRVRFYATEALGRMKYEGAIQPLIKLLETNNDKDLYIRHACVLALTRIGKESAMLDLYGHSSKAVRTAAVLVLRRMGSPNIAQFLTDKEEYIVTEAARGINDDLSIPTALPALAAVLQKTGFTSEPLLRRAINAALRVGGEKELDMLLAFAQRTDITDTLKMEALATLGTWASPSVLDRVDGRYRGVVERNPALIHSKIKPLIATLTTTTNPDVLGAVAGMMANLNITEASESLAKIYTNTKDFKTKTALLPALNQLKYPKMESLIKSGMEDADENVRSISVSLLDDSNITKASLPSMVDAIFTKGSIKEQQQLLVVLGKLERDKTLVVLQQLIGQMRDKKLSPSVGLELKEAVEKSGSADLKAQLDAALPASTLLDEYAAVLYGGNLEEGEGIFYYNGTAQCTKCHAINNSGGIVGPSLTHIGSTLKREQIMEALVEPSARISPGYGNVALKLKDGQVVYGILTKESDTALTITTSEAEPLIIPLSRIEKRDNLPSSMPSMHETLSKREIRDLVAFLVTLK